MAQVSITQRSLGLPLPERTGLVAGTKIITPRSRYQVVTCAAGPPGGRNSAWAHSRRLVLSMPLGIFAAGAGVEPADALSCPGLRGYELKQCLKEARQARDGEDSTEEDAREAMLATRQYEQPGELVTLPSGLQYRELLEGTGRPAELGMRCEICYVVYRLSTGAYFKYSSGGTPVYLYSYGYGNEGQDDVGSTYSFTLGDTNGVPRAVSVAMQGMKEGGKRRILVPPQLGWATSTDVGPKPPNFGASRRLENHKLEALLFEAELIRVRSAGEAANGVDADRLTNFQLRAPYSLPAPPTPFRAAAQR